MAVADDRGDRVDRDARGVRSGRAGREQPWAIPEVTIRAGRWSLGMP
jgi:hypothetical protein